MAPPPPPPHTSGTGEVARELIHRHFVKLQGLRTVDEQLAHDDQSKIKIINFTVSEFGSQGCPNPS